MRAAQGTQKHCTREKSRKPAEEIPYAQKQNGGFRKIFPGIPGTALGFRGVLTVARLCVGLITEKKTCCPMVAVP